MDTTSEQSVTRPVCVIVDTSVWRAEPLLKTPLGVSLVYNVSRRGGFIGLPEIVERELKQQIIEAGLEAATKAEGHLQRLHTIMNDGFINAVLLQYTADGVTEKLSQKVDERIAELSSILVREPFTFAHATAALEMVSAKLPPNGEQNQQFKDSALWQATLGLSIRYTAVLLTNDKGFFCNRDPLKGLAENLAKDCAEAGTTVRAFYGIRPYLDVLISDNPKFGYEQTREQIVSLVMPLLKLEADRIRAGMPTDVIDDNIVAFTTCYPDCLAIDYRLVFKIESASRDREEKEDDRRGIVYGSAYYHPNDGSLTDHYIQRIAVRRSEGYSCRDFKDYDSTFPIPRPLDWD